MRPLHPARALSVLGALVWLSCSWDMSCVAAQSSSMSDAPWLNEACDNPLLGLNGEFPKLSTYYYVQIYSTPSNSPDPGASLSGRQYEAIISLCNLTLKTPRFTRPCVLSKYFIGVWTSSGDCVGAYDTVVETTTVKNFNGTGGPSYTLRLGSSVNASQFFSYTLRCAPGSRLGGADTEAFSTQAMVQTTGDLCPFPDSPTGSPNGGGGDGDHDKKDVKGKVVAGVVIPVAAAACIALGVGIGVLYMRRRRLPVPSAAAEEEEGNMDVEAGK